MIDSIKQIIADMGVFPFICSVGVIALLVYSIAGNHNSGGGGRSSGGSSSMTPPTPPAAPPTPPSDTAQ